MNFVFYVKYDHTNTIHFFPGRYNLMLDCWNLSPDFRPAFTSIVSSLENLLQISQDYLDIATNDSETETMFIADKNPNAEAKFSRFPEYPIVYQEDQYLEPLTGPINYHQHPEPKSEEQLMSKDFNLHQQEMERQTKVKKQPTSFPNLSYQTVLFQEDY